MGIDLELHSARPVRKDWRRSRATLLAGSHEYGEALAEALTSLRHSGVPGRLTAVDPYGDTLMNEQEAGAALGEIDDLKRGCDNDRGRDALDDLAALLRACAATPGSYLWFIGD
ncbi:hypothetical protein OHA09_25100 [Streptomyces longwoodensis]|uniref:hypothetical protein n=1 Tax=Streptomyces longwoodensis TaxID=68231 RepID=UPI002E81D1F3|nr:hypothetical protein [Streptomyces longwoodensis]WUC60122.1 hypothetical protein OHA09_25100 [Streptomyces longwoodensis]